MCVRNPWWLVLGLLSVLALSGCSGGSDNPNDGGLDGDGGGGGDHRSPCMSDLDCQAPETCQPDYYCAYIDGPDPDDNKLLGHFDLAMDGEGGTSVVTGELDGKYVYMEFGWAEFDNGEGSPYVYLYGYLTSDLLNLLVFKLPREIPLDQEVRFGVGGVAIGTMERVRVDSNGNITEQTSIAEVIAGQVIFTQFGIDANDPVVGNFNIELRPVN